MGNAKVQFGLNAEFIKEDGEIKPWRLSNKATVVTPTFFEDGSASLKEKLENYTALSSGWRINKILEVNLRVTKYVNIMNLSGKFRICKLNMKY